MKVAIVGTGRVGSATAFCLAENKAIDELVLINRTKPKSVGLKMDLMGTFPHQGNVITVGDLSNANDADIILITYGEFGSPTGPNLLDVNKPIIEDLFTKVKPKTQAKIIITTTPIDDLALVVLKLSGVDSKNVIGFGGQLDANRLKYLIFKDTGDFSKDVDVQYIGLHGGGGIPVFRNQVSDRQHVIKEVKTFFGKYLFEPATSTYGTARELAKLVNALMHDEETVLCISYYDEEEKLFITWPCAVSKTGVVRPVEIELAEEEKKELEELMRKRKIR